MKVFLKICGIIGFSILIIWLLFLLLTFTGRISPTGLYPSLRNITIVIVMVSFVLAIIGVIFGFIYLRLERSRLGLIGAIFGILWILLVSGVVITAVKLKSMIIEYAKNPEKLTEVELRRLKCRQNQEQLELIANEFYKKDHPDIAEEEILNLDCGPKGDLVGLRVGKQIIYYTGDMSIFNCPADTNPNNVDYKVSKIDKDGYIHIECITEHGKIENHNR
ncbi:MAG: hypothetical protein ACUVWP_08200 [bacterium]